MTASTFCWVNVRAAASPVAAVEPISSVTNWILRPSTPPASLICLAAYSTDSFVLLPEVGPLSGTATPTRIASFDPEPPEPELPPQADSNRAAVTAVTETVAGHPRNFRNRGDIVVLLRHRH